MAESKTPSVGPSEYEVWWDCISRPPRGQSWCPTRLAGRQGWGSSPVRGVGHTVALTVLRKVTAERSRGSHFRELLEPLQPCRPSLKRRSWDQGATHPFSNGQRARWSLKVLPFPGSWRGRGKGGEKKKETLDFHQRGEISQWKWLSYFDLVLLHSLVSNPIKVWALL